MFIIENGVVTFLTVNLWALGGPDIHLQYVMYLILNRINMLLTVDI